MRKSLLEVVIDSALSAIAASLGGADRVELCDNLLEGGTTPSAGTIQVVRNQIKIDLQVMIRPRGGDFLYSELEYEIMKKDIMTAKNSGADGVVFGILHEDGTIDTKRCKELIALAEPMSITFHRAFDMTKDPYQALEELIHLKVNRVLTSGQQSSAMEGAALLKKLIELAGDKIIIMPAGGITVDNISQIKKITQASEYHISGRSKVDSKMIYRKNDIFMGSKLIKEEYANLFTDSEKIKIVKNLISN